MAIQKRADQQLYTGKGPLDAKSLVKTYADLLNINTWTANDTFVAYNGMIVAVWLDKSDALNNAIYYLYDPTVTSALKKPDVTKATNWHRIAEINEIQDITARIANNTQLINDEILARAEAIAAIYKAGVDGAPASGLLVEEIARASAAEQAIVEALNALVGNDTDKTVRDITKEEIASIVDTGDKTVSAYIADQLAKLVQVKASSEVTIDEDGILGLGEVSTDKLVQGTKTLVLSGGHAN